MSYDNIRTMSVTYPSVVVLVRPMITKIRKFLEFDNCDGNDPRVERGRQIESSRTREVVEALVELVEACEYMDESDFGNEAEECNRISSALANLRAKLDQAEGTMQKEFKGVSFADIKAVNKEAYDLLMDEKFFLMSAEVNPDNSDSE